MRLIVKLLVVLSPVFVALACAEPVDRTGEDPDTTADAPELPVGSQPKQAQQVPLDPGAGWPEDCEEVYALRAHGEKTPGDATPYRVPGGFNEGVRFYFDRPWQGERQLLMTRVSFDNRSIVHHWDLYTLENFQGADADIISSRNFFDQARIQDMQPVVGGGGNPEDAKLPEGVGFELPAPARLGFLFELHYFVPEDRGPQEDASTLELCVTSQHRPHAARSHLLGRVHFELPAHQGTDIHADCVPSSVSEPVHLVAVAPHMHAAGTHAKLVLNRASGEQVVLYDAPYDYREQRVYGLKSPDGQPEVLLHPGESLSVTCSYDNTRDDAILSGPTPDNEMCTVPVWAWPAGLLSNGYDPRVNTSCAVD